MPRKHDRDEERRQARRVVEEAGGGEAEGFEKSEEALRRQAEHSDPGHNPKYDQGDAEENPPQGTYGEADEARSAERSDSDY